MNLKVADLDLNNIFLFFVDENGETFCRDKLEFPYLPKLEELIPKITEAVDVRLKEMKEQLFQIKEEIGLKGNQYVDAFNNGNTSIIGILTEIGKKIN